MEQILVVPRNALETVGSFQGIQPAFQPYLDAFFKEGIAYFTDRQSAETDPSKQQIIPYCVINHNSKYLIYTRGKLGGEKRLHAKKSIGLGGHINPKANQSSIFTKGDYKDSVLRELSEEINWNATGCPLTTLALIKDDSNAVGEVHLGICELLQPEIPPSLTTLEGCILEPQWLSLDELKARREEFETWSQLVIDHLAML
jgi:predicted NUDIX family phosphoesterase